VWSEFQSHPGSRFRMIALNALQKHLLVTPDFTRHASVRTHAQRCLVALVQEVSSALLLCIHSGDRVDESAIGVQAVLHLFHALDSSSPRTTRGTCAHPLTARSLARGWRIRDADSLLARLSASLTRLFSHSSIVRGLQTSVMSMCAAQQHAAMAEIAAVAAKQHVPVKIDDSGKTKTSKKRTPVSMRGRR
jgi:hypothetical protein